MRLYYWIGKTDTYTLYPLSGCTKRVPVNAVPLFAQLPGLMAIALPIPPRVSPVDSLKFDGIRPKAANPYERRWLGTTSRYGVGTRPKKKKKARHTLLTYVSPFNVAELTTTGWVALLDSGVADTFLQVAMCRATAISDKNFDRAILNWRHFKILLR